MQDVPFFHRLSTRLTLLILVVVAVLAGAAGILLVRGFNLAGAGILPSGDETVLQAELNAIIRGTVINLVAVFLFTLVAATVFSRSLLVEPITRLTKATRELAEGNLGVTLPVTSRSELGELAEAFNLMSLRLAERTRELTESNEALRIAEERYLETMALLERRVQERTAELEDLLDKVHEQAAEEERQHLARELHDSVSQALYGILLGTHAAQRQLEKDPASAASALGYVEGLAEAGIAEMRALIFELRPESLEQDGLVGALRKQLEALETRHGLETDHRMEQEPQLPLKAKQMLFRVAQEATHNIVKHARAKQVEMRLEQDDAGVSLLVSDDGVGFDTEQEFPGHLGLRSMRERLERVGGSFRIDSEPGSGTTVAVVLPPDAQLDENGDGKDDRFASHSQRADVDERQGSGEA